MTPVSHTPGPSHHDHSDPPARSLRGQSGQSTVEYALILLGAAAVALVVVAWVTQTDLIGRLFDTVVGRILQQAG
jgi:Flp pilus assembly pilin Flp